MNQGEKDGFYASDFGRVLQLREFPRSGLPVGILVLDFFIILADIVASIIDAVLGMQIVTGLFGLVTIIPNIAIAIRRLHDLDRTGWWILLGFIPLIGWIILLIWYVTKGTDGPNRFGPDHLGLIPLPNQTRAGLSRMSSSTVGLTRGYVNRADRFN